MHPYLVKLNVSSDVQNFFEPVYTVDPMGNLLFSYGDSFEHYGFGFHKVPVSENLLIAGSRNFNAIRYVIVGTSCMDAIAYLTLNRAGFRYTGNLLFLSTGARPVPDQLNWISKNLSDKSFISIFGKDLLGRLAEVKLAAAIRRVPVAMSLSGETLHINIRMKDYEFSVDRFSLHLLEKSMGFRFKIPAHKPKNSDSWITQLHYHTLNFQ